GGGAGGGAGGGGGGRGGGGGGPPPPPRRVAENADRQSRGCPADRPGPAPPLRGGAGSIAIAIAIVGEDTHGPHVRRCAISHRRRALAR
ncbi:hypothetical protein Q6A38_12010, partial [Xanthomonas euvesicatoria pv. eucalypti]|uniref:hypothetical protein n=1 Tax=Xanthomonas euvesicatoria TaxID=456327 RepID=UPI0026E32C68